MINYPHVGIVTILDIHSSTVVLEQEVTRKRVGDTDIGEELKLQIKELEKLLDAYRKGLIKEKR